MHRWHGAQHLLSDLPVMLRDHCLRSASNGVGGAHLSSSICSSRAASQRLVLGSLPSIVTSTDELIVTSVTRKGPGLAVTLNYVTSPTK